MKIILAGSTGFVGQEVLKQCCESPQIDSIVVLSRRPLPQALDHAKVNTIIINDFTSYSQETINVIADADGCIWTLGGSSSSPNVEIDFPMAFTQAMTRSWSQRLKPFRYVHCSGILAEKDQTKRLYFLQEGRRAKGQAEADLMNFAVNSHQRDLWQTCVMRPSMVLPIQPNALQRISSFIIGGIMVDDLARAAVDLTVNGNSKQILEHEDLILLGKNVQQ
ncbi:hypothetical protein H2198_003858 [Neophaeococcomyces mojaviensis]|uniref:Uncharacterized protein n=1 Tax=Neophaeococcomyces mojaviensis TaxID=3383035 RepID=A0ACC3AA62_9EURO|nr:hypothetical protein H2198_003858 [Knufia sp. JES_112]